MGATGTRWKDLEIKDYGFVSSQLSMFPLYKNSHPLKFRCARKIQIIPHLVYIKAGNVTRLVDKAHIWPAIGSCNLNMKYDARGAFLKGRSLREGNVDSERNQTNETRTRVVVIALGQFKIEGAEGDIFHKRR